MFSEPFQTRLKSELKHLNAIEIVCFVEFLFDTPSPLGETSRKGNRYGQFHTFAGSATGLLLSLRIPQAWGFGAQGSWDHREPWGPGGLG